MPFTLPLNVKIPLNTTQDWPGYKTEAVRPLAFGSVLTKPLQYSDNGEYWHLSDEHISSVVSVRRNRTSTDSWNLILTSDQTGKAISLLQVWPFLQDSESLEVRFNGIANPVTGSVLTNPADWMWYVLNKIVGQPISYGRMSRFREECDRRGITINGLLSTTRSTRAALTEVLEPLGILWSDQAPGLARLWPLPIDPDAEPLYGEPITPFIGNQLSTTSSATDWFGAIKLNFGFDHANNRHLGSVTARNLVALEKYPMLPTKEINAGWCLGSSQAIETAKRWLSWLSRRIYKATVTVQTTDDIPPCSLFTMDFPHPPVQGDMVAHRSNRDPITNTQNLSFEYTYEDVSASGAGVLPPPEALTDIGQSLSPISISLAYDTLPLRITVETRADSLAIRILNDQGEPIENAQVTITGPSFERGKIVEPVAGYAYFPRMIAGQYRITIEASGFSTIIYTAAIDGAGTLSSLTEE